jgi:ABC-type transporter Mla subunit MlaD
LSKRKPSSPPARKGPPPATLPHADAVIAAKLTGKSTAEIAADIGEHRTTLSRWFNHPEQLARMARIREALQAASQLDLLDVWQANIKRLKRQMEACTTAAEGAELQRQMEQLLVGIGMSAAGTQPASNGGSDQVSFTLREAVMNLRRSAAQPAPAAPAAETETIEAYAETEADS